MWLSDISVKRPVFASVINILIVAFGLVALSQLPLREYPDSDPSIISVTTIYPGASSHVIESKITQIIEDSIAGVEGIQNISSNSLQGISSISVNFDSERDIDNAVNDIRDRVSQVTNRLPKDVQNPIIKKANRNDRPIIWLNLTGHGMSMMALTDYANRYIKDAFATLDGVVQVYVAGGLEKAMRIWLDSSKLAARNLTVNEVEQALKQENIELPAGTIESINKDFTVRVKRQYTSVDDFKELVIKQGEAGHLIRLGDVARVEIGPVETRSVLRGNGSSMLGIGVVKQSKANTLAVAKRVKELMTKINETLPSHLALEVSYDTSQFIDRSIDEVVKTLIIAILLVILVIYGFLGSARTMLIPALTVPVSLFGTFLILYSFGYTLNLITLLALVLAIGLVVDDTIVVIENIHRRIESGESRLVASFKGARQVGFAVIATTVVLVFVFIPITFMEGRIGQIFTEFSVAITSAVIFSSLVALSLSPMLASKIIEEKNQVNRLTHKIDEFFEYFKHFYRKSLIHAIAWPKLNMAVVLVIFAMGFFMFKKLPSEFVPQEDRGAFFFWISGPEGVSYDYMLEQAHEVEKRLMPLVKSGEAHRLLMRVPGDFGTTENFSNAIGIIVLSDWDTGRKSLDHYLNEVRDRTSDIAGVQVFPVAWHPLQDNDGRPVQFVLGGSSYEELTEWRDVLLKKLQDNPNFIRPDSDYKETKPHIGISIDKDRAGKLGVTMASINQSLEALLAHKKITTFIENGIEYDVILASEQDLKRSPSDINNIYVRSNTSKQLIPLSNVVKLEEFADAGTLKRYNRLRAVTIEANLKEGYRLGEALEHLENLVKTELPEGVNIDYKGASYQFKFSNNAIYFVSILAMIVVFLVLAGLFESFIHPFIIMVTVPLAISGALLGLLAFGQSLNIYSQIGLIILIGLAAKNGILIVEFINQLREEGQDFESAVIEALEKRLRPIIMTGLTTAMGTLPLILSSGAGAETRFVIGIVILSGVLLSIIFTLYVIPVFYRLFARNTLIGTSPSKQLEQAINQSETKVEYHD